MADDIERDVISGMSIPHLSLVLRHFLPMALNCEDRQILVKAVMDSWGSMEDINADLLVSGSSAEGINLPMHFDGLLGSNRGLSELKSSDIDSMIIMRDKIVCDPRDLDSLNKDHENVMEIFTEGIHPGYLQVRVHKSRNVSRREMFVEKEGDDYIYYAPNKVKDMLSEGLAGLMKADPSVEIVQQGPACNVKVDFEYVKAPEKKERDLVFPVFCCPIWPEAVADWKSRERSSNWPSVELVEEIVSKGCHIVPVCHTESKEPDLEWRLSFSVAELMLMHRISRSQRLCYLLLKTLHSQALKIPDVRGLVTYHMKTLFLWMCEKIPLDEWNPDNVGPCLLKMLDHLHKCLNEKCIPSYFWPENNLIDRVAPAVCEDLALRVASVRADPLKYLFEFNKKFKWCFGPMFINAEDQFRVIVEDAKTATSLGESYEKVLQLHGPLNAAYHLLEHGQLLKAAMKQENNPDPGDPSYKLVFDNAIDILEDMARFHEKVTGEEKNVSELVLMCAAHLLQYPDCMIGFLNRVQERHPDNPHKAAILSALGRLYHVKYLRPLGENRKKEIQARATKAFEDSRASDGGASSLVDHAQFLCAAGERVKAIQLLTLVLTEETEKGTAAEMTVNTYSRSELQTLDETVRQVSAVQHSVSTFSYALAAYLIVKLENDKTKRCETIRNFQTKCEQFSKCNIENPLLIGNALVFLGYACEMAEEVSAAKSAHENAVRLLPADKLPNLHLVSS